MLEKRNSLSYSTINTKSKEIQLRFTHSDEFNHAKMLAGYYAIGSEVRTAMIIDTALKSDRLVALPRIEGDHIKFYQILFNTVLVANRIGIREPPISSNYCIPENIDVILVPGIVFDTSGYRLGYGGGYYDRFIARKKKSTISVGLAYEFQICNKIHRSYDDQKIDLLVTEKRMLYFC